MGTEKGKKDTQDEIRSFNISTFEDQEEEKTLEMTRGELLDENNDGVFSGKRVLQTECLYPFFPDSR